MRLDLASPLPTTAFTSVPQNYPPSTRMGKLRLRDRWSTIHKRRNALCCSAGTDVHSNCLDLMLKNPMATDSGILLGHKKE